MTGLDGDAAQLALPLDGARDGALDSALDAVRDRFGSRAVTRAVLLHRGPRLQTWLQPGEDLET